MAIQLDNQPCIFENEVDPVSMMFFGVSEPVFALDGTREILNRVLELLLDVGLPPVVVPRRRSLISGVAWLLHSSSPLTYCPVAVDCVHIPPSMNALYDCRGR